MSSSSQFYDIALDIAMDLKAGLDAVAPSNPPGVWEALSAARPRLEAMGVETPRQWAALLGQCAHESGHFTRRIESLWYTAERIIAVWPSYFPSLTFAREYEKNPEKLGNYVYGVKKAQQLGNLTPEDGFRFRGRGWIQITGRDNYTRSGTFLNLDLPGQPALAEASETAFLVAGWFLKVHKRQSKTALQWADDGNCEMVTRIINSGMAGLAGRRQKTARALLALLAGDPSERPTVRFGDFDEAVVALQEILSQLGYTPGPIDGWFGSATSSAVMAFQTDKGLPSDGIVGSATWAKLDAAISEL